MIKPLTSLSLFFLLTQPTFAIFDCVKGEGQKTEVTHSIAKVSSITLETSVDIVIKKGEKDKLVIKGPKDLVSNIELKQTDSNLQIKSEKCMRNSDSIELVATLRSLTQIKVLGSSDVEVKDVFSSQSLNLGIAGSGDISGSFNTDVIEIDIKGSGKINLNGKTKDLSIDIKGSGDVSTTELTAKNVEVSIKGAGDVDVRAEDVLDIKIFGSGDVRYLGRPKVDFAKFGSGSVKAL